MLSRTETSTAYMRGGSCCSPNVSLFSIRKTRLLVGIGKTFEPTRSGTGSFARSRHAHALGQGLPLIRALLQTLHHSSQARLRTCPDRLGDGGDGLLWSQVGKAGRPSTDRAAPVPIRMRRYASAATGVSSHTVHSDGNTDSVWFGMPRLRPGCRQFLQPGVSHALQTALGREGACSDHTAFGIL